MSLTTDFDSARTFARLAHEMVSSGADDAAATVAALARTALGYDGAAIVDLATPTKLRVLAASDPEVGAILVRVANATTDPLTDALERTNTVHSRDLAAELRWPDFSSAVIDQTSIRSITAVRLSTGDTPLGALVVYGREPMTEDVAAAEVFAAHAALALETTRALSQADHLQRALASNRRIGIALGVLMSSRKITEDQAFDLLRSTSQKRGSKLRAVADAVVETGTLPPTGPERAEPV